jgi:hypothetical protein
MDRLKLFLFSFALCTFTLPAFAQGGGAPDQLSDPIASPDEAPAASPDEAIKAPDDTGAPSSQNEPKKILPTEPVRVPAVGELVGDYRIITFTSEKKLPDGRATDDACGFFRDVIVERSTAKKSAASALTRTQLQVPCVKGQAGLIAGAALLTLKEEPPEEPSPAAAPEPDFQPVAEEALTKKAMVLNGFNQAPPPDQKGEDGEIIEGKVELEVQVTKKGISREITVVTPADELLNQMSIAAARNFLWMPAEVDGQPVDSLNRLEIDWKKPDPAAGRIGPVESETLFHKGELSHLGSVKLYNTHNSIGVALGASQIDNIYYASLSPELNLHIGPFSLGAGVPLQFEVFNMANVDVWDPETYSTTYENAGTFRMEDWNNALSFPYTDLVRPLKYVTWGRKEDHIYVDLNRVHPITIGHGQLVRRYAPNTDINDSNLFAEFDAYYHFGGVELMVGPLPIPRLVGGLAFVKPLGLFLDDYFSRSLSLGVSYVADLNAPTQLTTITDPDTGELKYPIDDNHFMWENRNSVTGNWVQGAGVDAEFKAAKWAFIDLKFYGDYSHLLFPGVPEANIEAFNGGGATVGSLLRLSFGSTPIRDLDDETDAVRLGQEPREMRATHAARFRAEGKFFSPQYLPSYFNPLYETDKYQFGFGNTAEGQRATLPTKVGYLASQSEAPWRMGYYLEGTYSWLDWFAVTTVYEDAWTVDDFDPVAAGRNLVVHAESNGMGFLQFFASYHFRNFEFENWSKVFQFSTDSEIFYAGARLQILFVAFNLGVQRGFSIDYLETDTALEQVPNKGEDLYRLSSVGLKNQWSGNFNVEIGWQF